jgi:hypothetical protein
MVSMSPLDSEFVAIKTIALHIFDRVKLNSMYGSRGINMIIITVK